MIQFGTTEDDLPGGGASCSSYAYERPPCRWHASKVYSPYPADRAKIVGECTGDYAHTETQQELRSDCWARALLIAEKHAGTSDYFQPYPAAMCFASPDST